MYRAININIQQSDYTRADRQMARMLYSLPTVAHIPNRSGDGSKIVFGLHGEEPWMVSKIAANRSY